MTSFTGMEGPTKYAIEMNYGKCRIQGFLILCKISTPPSLLYQFSLKK